jgi:Putative zinc-finger
MTEHAGDALSALVDGELEPDEDSEVRAHVAACSRCAEELAAIRRSRRLVRLLPGMDVPDDVTTRLLAVEGPDAAGRSSLVALAQRRRLAAFVAVAASLAALALVGGPADPGPGFASASFTGAMEAHADTLQSGLLGALGPMEAPEGSPTTVPPLPVDRLRAPYRAPMALDGGYRLVQAFPYRHGLQLLYQRGPYSLSVFELEGALDHDVLPEDGHWIRDGHEPAYDVPAGPGQTLVVLDRSDLTVTAVGDAPGDDVLVAARSLPDPRDLPMGTRLRRACADALSALSPLP